MLMSGNNYRESQRRYQPRAYVDGRLVGSVADEPSLAPGVNGVDLTYDYALREQFRAVMRAAVAAAGAEGKRPRQILVAGMEAHVCVLQTVLGLLQADYHCWLATDAVGSRRHEDRQAAIERLRDAGATPASAEMALFEWAKHADHPAFRTILSLVKAH